jgi:biotin carboxyl carrier protein
MPKILLKSANDADPVAVELARHANGSGSIDARIDDAHIEAALIRQNVSSGCLRIHGRVIPYYTARDNDSIAVWIEGKTHVFQVMEQVARRATSSRSAGAATDTLVAPMPGTVLKINVKAGDGYEAHQPLIIMESMKMEMSLSSPQAGRVAELCCKVGELVALGKVLATLEAVSEPDETHGDTAGPKK